MAELDINKIEQDLKKRFAEPLKDYYKRRIIFWHDEERSFEELIDDINIPEVKIHKMTGTNNFATKKLLLEDDLDSNYLVYDPNSYGDIRENWLLDIELYSEVFRADLISIRMEDFKMAETPALRKAMKLYSRFFDNQDRVSKLKLFGSGYQNPGQLHLDILAVLSGARANSISRIIKAILSAGIDHEENEALIQIEKFGSPDVLWDLINRYTGFVVSNGVSKENLLIDLATHILLSALTVTIDPSDIKDLEKYYSISHQGNCYEIINEWLHSEDEDKLYEICRMAEEKVDLPQKLKELDVTRLLNSEIFPCINELILSKYLNDVSDHIIRTRDIISTIEKRRTFKWYKRVKHYYEGLLQVAFMQEFYQSYSNGFHHGLDADMWKRYMEEYYLMDTYYRHFHLAFRPSLTDSGTELGDAFKSVADVVENLYKNWYLKELSGKWTNLIRDELKDGPVLKHFHQQKRFYDQNVQPLTKNGKVFVIISDALRYEVAAELKDKLIRETRGEVNITAMQGILPSVTKYGMAALLPHDVLSVHEDGKVYCDDRSTEGTAKREQILQDKEPESVAITYKDLIPMKQAEKRKLSTGKKVIFIYHNAIDTIGEDKTTEDQVFEACETAIDELKNLINIIVNEMNGTNVLITTDHGFLYSYKNLQTYDKAEKDYVSGKLIETDRRYIITDQDATGEHLIEVPMNSYGCDYKLMIPQENIRFKAGGGMNYVHGGVTLQEMMIPVVTFKNLRSRNKNFVENTKAVIEMISQSKKISNNMFSLNFYQKEPVGGKVSPCTYQVFFTDSNGHFISDVKTIIADKTTDNSADRVFRVRFTLKGQNFDRTEDYYLNILEKNETCPIEKIAFNIDIAFSNDFDF